MQIVRKMTELEAFEVLSVVLKHPVLKLINIVLIIATNNIKTTLLLKEFCLKCVN